MNKYDDVLLTMKLVKRDYKNDEYAHYHLNKVVDLLKQAQKQEKLLELYRELMTAKDDMFDCCEIVDDEFYDIRKTETNLEEQIEELEKQIRELENEKKGGIENE